MPAFRVVAETEHLPSAAQALHVSPSALSRAIKQLEHQLGALLFARDGGRMRLNRAGRDLLVATRDAMRRIDDGLEQASQPGAIPIRIAGAAPWLELLALPAVAELGHAVEVIVEAPADPISALRRGVLDLFVSELAPSPAGDIVIDRLGPISYGVFGRPRPGSSRPFAVWTELVACAPPNDATVALRSPHLPIIVEACSTGAMQAVLPVAIARAHGLGPATETRARPASELALVRRAPLTATTGYEDVAIRLRAIAADRLAVA